MGEVALNAFVCRVTSLIRDGSQKKTWRLWSVSLNNKETEGGRFRAFLMIEKRKADVVRMPVSYEDEVALYSVRGSSNDPVYRGASLMRIRCLGTDKL